jgi:hypothetical protein
LAGRGSSSGYQVIAGDAALGGVNVALAVALQPVLVPTTLFPFVIHPAVIGMRAICGG